MGKITILCYALSVVFGTVALTIALTYALDSWKGDQHVRGLLWSCVVGLFAVAAVLVGGMPEAMRADAEVAAKAKPDVGDAIGEVKELLRAQTNAQQRSYLQIDNFTLAIGADRTEIIFRLTADGPTPIDVEAGEIRISIDDPPLSSEDRRLGLYTARITPQQITPRQQAIQRVHVAALPDVHQQRLLKGPPTEVFYVGQIHYWDAFKNTGTKRHLREFAYGVTDGRIRPLDLAIWARNNETDEP